MKNLILTLAAGVVLSTSCGQEAAEIVKARTIVTCDPELDDNNSLIRYLLFSTDFQTEGIIYASSQFHWKGDGKGTTQFIPGSEYDRGDIHLGPQTSWRWAPDESFIDDNVEAYAQVYPNLVKHDPSYPSPEELKSKVKWGNVEFQGDMSEETEGSNLIKDVILDDKGGPVFVQVWGGGSTVGRALKSIEEAYKGTSEWDEIYAKVCGKVILCLSGDQDQVYANYIKPVWPDIYVQSVTGSSVSMGYGSQTRQTPESYLYGAEWIAENILIGPIGTRYRVWGDGKQMCPGDIYDYFGEKGKTREELVAMGYSVWMAPQEEGSFISEGDTPCYLNLIDNGLRAWEDDSWGGWAGRKRNTANEGGAFPGFGGMSRLDEMMPTGFLTECQNAFAARMKWSVTPEYSDANHYPVISGPTELHASHGEKVSIKVSVSDPDSDELERTWMILKVGTYPGVINFDYADDFKAEFTVPDNAQSGDTIHILLQVRDEGTPQLTRYLRTIVTVK